MEALLSQAENLPSLLAASRSAATVRSWDAEALSRALRWGRYFQQLHGRLRHKPSLRAALARRLRRRGGPTSCLSFGHLKRCPELLGLALLENRALPAAARQRLLRALLHPPAAEDEEEPPFAPLLARRKAASQLLSLGAWVRAAPPAVPPSLQTQGQLLLARLREYSEEQEAATGDPQGDFSSHLAAWSQLDQLPPGPMLYKAVAAALLEKPRGAEAAGAARATLLSWLLQPQQGKRLAAFCRLLPASWVASLCGQYPEVRAPYLGLLSEWGSQLCYDPLCGEWRGDGCLEVASVSWQEMGERVSCLLSPSHAPEPLAREAESHLRDLKARDGDFEVRGLSVWTDLLLDAEQRMPKDLTTTMTENTGLTHLET